MNKQSRETMEQFLYTYLNQKYGLKSIVIDQANAIIQAINHYSDQNHDVLIFGKVLRHQVDEEFRYVQLAIRNNLLVMLNGLLSDKYFNKSQTFINQALTDIKDGKVLLEYSMWKKIVEHMYDSQAALEVENKLRQLKYAKQMEQQELNCVASHSVPSFATENRAEERKKSQVHSSRRRIGGQRLSQGSNSLTYQVSVSAKRDSKAIDFSNRGF